MFFGCSSLKELNLSNFYTNNAKYMSYMFSGCFSLKKLIINNFNFDNVLDMYHMFYECSDILKKEIREKYNNIKEEAFE